MSKQKKFFILKSYEQFNELLKMSEELKCNLFLDFFATWCGPCKKIGPVFEEEWSLNKNDIFIKIDVDQFSEIAKKFEVSSLPTFIALAGGEIKEVLIGADEDKLQKLCQTHRS